MPTPPSRIICVLNAGSGTGAADTAQARVQQFCAASGCAVHFVMIKPGCDLEGELAEALATPADVVVAGGGDGTVSAVVTAIIAHELRLGVLPLGTLNHFAQDLGIPSDLDAALEVIFAGHTLAVDVGVVNDRNFVNNSSLGLYAQIVQLRERHKARGLRKWFVAAWATLGVTEGSSAFRVRIVVDGRDVVRWTPLLFIGNNEYRMAGIDAGTRDSLTGGALAMYVVKTDGRRGLLRLLWRILSGTAVGSDELALLCVREATIDLPHAASRAEIAVAIDGEVMTLSLPLSYAVRPAALHVCVPAPSAG